MRPNRSRPSRPPRHRSASDPPLFIRFCSAIVDNLGLLLRGGLLVGAIVLVSDLRQALDTPDDDDRQSVQILETVAEPAPDGAAKPAGSKAVMSDGVRRALNCTYRDYRETHVDECADEDSDVYRGPSANPDDRGFLWDGPTVLFARSVAPDNTTDL